MALPRLGLAELKAQCPEDLVYCDGYVWYEARGYMIGRGAFGEVYQGWNEVRTSVVMGIH